MIQKLHRVTSFGVFNDFSWPSGLHEFKRFNLLFGWNYSGKTTLSRSLRCFELLQAHPDFSQAEVQLHCEGNVVHTLTNTAGPHQYRVFNVDFIRDNLQFDEGTAKPILILGAADIAKQEALQSKKQQLAAVCNEITQAASSQRIIDGALEKALMTTARDSIKKPLNRLNYDKAKLAVKVEACKNDPAKRLLSEPEYKTLLETYNSTDRKPPISQIQKLQFASITTLCNRVDEACTRSVKSVTIQAVADNQAIEQWVNRGRGSMKTRPTVNFLAMPCPRIF